MVSNRRKSEPAPKVAPPDTDPPAETGPRDSKPGTLESSKDPPPSPNPGKLGMASAEPTEGEPGKTETTGKVAKGGKRSLEAGLLGLPLPGSKSAKEQEKAAKADKAKEEARVKRELKKKENEAAKIQSALIKGKASLPPSLVASAPIRASLTAVDRMAIAREVADKVVERLEPLIDSKIARAVQQSVKSARLPLDVPAFAEQVAKRVTNSQLASQDQLADAVKALQKEASNTLAFTLKIDDMRTVLDHLVDQNKRSHASALAPSPAYPPSTTFEQPLQPRREMPKDAAPKRRREVSPEPRSLDSKSAKRGLGAFQADDDDFRSRNVPEDRILWVRALSDDLYLPSPAIAAELLALSGIPLDYLTPEGGYILGWVALDNNGTPSEWTKSYRLVLTSAFAKTLIQRELKKVQLVLKSLGMQVSDWEWCDDVAERSYGRAALKASEDTSRALELAYNGAVGFDGAFRSLNDKVAEARSFHSGVTAGQHGERGGYRGGGRSSRGYHRRGRGGY